MTNIKQLITTLVALFAISTGAWADETPIVTITATGSGPAYSVEGIVTLEKGGAGYGAGYGWVSGPATNLTVTAADGVTITKVKFIGNQGGSWEDTESPFQVLLQGFYVKNASGTKIGSDDGVISIEVYGTIAPAGPEVNGPTIVEGKPQWTFAMPAGNVELQVEYYPGMLVKPTNLVGGTMEIKGVTDTTLPEGFEKDTEGNIYVAKDTKFTVKAVPAEGYHLVGWSDDATNKELEREFTMTDDDFTVTALFSDEYDLAFEALNANTIESGKATVTVGGTAATVTEGKLEGVKMGSEVKLKAKEGYKFRKVEVKKGGAAAAKTITIGDMELTYADGDTWETIVSKNPDKIKIFLSRIVQLAQPAANKYLYLSVWYTEVKPSEVIDTSKNYDWTQMEVAW